MGVRRLELLPKELIALIASFATPSAVLSLSAACRSSRAACWDPLIFRSILVASQHGYWSKDSLDIEAIARRAGNDVTIWAQYALADEKATILAESVPDDKPWAITETKHPLKAPQTYISYLPELFVVKHPFMADQCWESAVLCCRDATPSQIFSLALTILATEDNMITVLQTLFRARLDWFPFSSDTSAFLWALCTIALWARTMIKQRLAAWPYNDAARVPFIGIPKARHIPLQPLSDGYNLPAPFSRRSAELLGSQKSSFSAWDSWYRLHNLATLQYLAEGTWSGYDIHYGRQQNLNIGIDAPMVQIQFEFSEGSPVNTFACDESQPRRFHAKDCLDGLDSFDLNGTVTLLNDEIKLTARKQYQRRGFGWEWDCRLTPFGIVGFWGARRPDDIVEDARFWDHRNPPDRNLDTLDRYGILWLWKDDWTQSV